MFQPERKRKNNIKCPGQGVEGKQDSFEEVKAAQLLRARLEESSVKEKNHRPQMVSL